LHYTLAVICFLQYRGLFHLEKVK